jgi:two-component SAPR family response regulator
MLFSVHLWHAATDDDDKYKISVKWLKDDVFIGAAHWTENEKKRSFIFFSLFDLKIWQEIKKNYNFNTATHGAQ